MREVFIGIAVPTATTELLQNIQIRATGELRFREGYDDLVLSHGNSPFHVTLIPPFISRTADEDSCIESGLESVSKDFGPFTLALEEATSIGHDTICLPVRDQQHLQSLRIATHNRIKRLAPPDFTPHVSLARKFPHGRFRDVLTACIRACEVYRSSFPLTFRVEGLSLFVKEDDGTWKIHTTYHFGRRRMAA